MSAYLKASIKRSYAEGFLSELERNNNQYFLFIARSVPWTDENAPPTAGTTNYPDSDANEYEAVFCLRCHDMLGQAEPYTINTMTQFLCLMIQILRFFML